MPWQFDIGVGNNDAIEDGIVEIFAVAAIDDRFAVAPIAIDGNDEAAVGRRGGGKRGITGKRARDERCAGDDGGRGFEEVASFHVFPFDRQK